MSPKTSPYFTRSTIVATPHIYSVVMELHQHNIFTFCQQNLFQCLVHDERQPRHITYLTTKTVVRKNQENDSQTGSRAGQGSACAKRGGGGTPSSPSAASPAQLLAALCLPSTHHNNKCIPETQLMFPFAKTQGRPVQQHVGVLKIKVPCNQLETIHGTKHGCKDGFFKIEAFRLPIVTRCWH